MMPLRDSAFCESRLGAFYESPIGARNCPDGCFYIGKNFTRSIFRDDGTTIWTTNHSSVGGAAAPLRINDKYIFGETKPGPGAGQASLMLRSTGAIQWTKTVDAGGTGVMDLFLRGGYAYFHFQNSSRNPLVKKYDVATGTEQWVWTSSNVSRLNGTSAIWVDSSDVLHVGYRDASTSSIAFDTVDDDGNDIATVGGSIFNAPVKLAMDPDESYYIVAGNGLNAYNLNGTTKWNPVGSYAALGDIVFRDGFIFVCESGASARILRASPTDGSIDATIASGFNSVYGLDVDEDDYVYAVIGSTTDEVRRYEQDGTLDWNISTASDPHGIRVRADPG